MERANKSIRQEMRRDRLGCVVIRGAKEPWYAIGIEFDRGDPVGWNLTALRIGNSSGWTPGRKMVLYGSLVHFVDL